MKRTTKIALIAVSVCLVVAGAMGIHAWRYEHYAWPKMIQIELLGVEVVGSAPLAKFERDLAYGEGRLRWTYEIKVPSRELVQLCGTKALLECKLERRGKPEGGVDTYIYLENGNLIIEEWWS